MNLESTTSNLCRIDKKLIGAGVLQLLPLSLFVLVFALAFGIAASQTGLDPFSSLAMSALVFAGASQFAALELGYTGAIFYPAGHSACHQCTSFADGSHTVPLARPVASRQAPCSHAACD